MFGKKKTPLAPKRTWTEEELKLLDQVLTNRIAFISELQNLNSDELPSFHAKAQEIIRDKSIEYLCNLP